MSDATRDLKKYLKQNWKKALRFLPPFCHLSYTNPEGVPQMVIIQNGPLANYLALEAGFKKPKKKPNPEDALPFYPLTPENFARALEFSAISGPLSDVLRPLADLKADEGGAPPVIRVTFFDHAGQIVDVSDAVSLMMQEASEVVVVEPQKKGPPTVRTVSLGELAPKPEKPCKKRKARGKKKEREK